MVVQASLVPALLSLVLGLGPAGASAWHRNRRSPWDDNGWSPPVQTGLPHNPEMGIENMEELLAGGPAAPMPTTAPSRELFERAVLPNTCGFISGKSALSCNVGLTCTNSGAYRDCCSGGGCTSLAFSTACLDSTAPACQSAHPGTYCCTFNPLYPYCITYLWSTSATPGQVFTVFNCDRQIFSGTEVLLAEPTSTSTYLVPTTSRVISVSTASTSTATTTSGVAAGASSGSGSQSNRNVGAIVGGVIGGIAVIGLLALAVLFLLKRQREQREEQEAHAAAAAAAGGGFVGGVPSMVMSNPTGTTIQPVQGMGGWGPAAGVAGAGALAAGVYDPNKHYSVTSTAPSYGGTGPGALALSPQNTGSPGGAFAPNGQQQSNMDYGQQQAQQPQQQFDYSQQQQGYNYGQQQQYAQQQQPQQQQQFAGGSASAEQAPGGYYAYDQGQQPQPQQAQGGQGQWTLGGQTYQQQ